MLYLCYQYNTHVINITLVVFLYFYYILGVQFENSVSSYDSFDIRKMLNSYEGAVEKKVLRLRRQINYEKERRIIEIPLSEFVFFQPVLNDAPQK